MSSDLHVRPVGLSAHLLEVPAALVATLTRHLQDCRRDGGLPGVVDIVPGARTVLVDGAAAPALGQALARWTADDSGSGPAPRTVEIPVTYDGPDLADVATTAGMGPDEVVALHTQAPMTVAFCGFAPGFAYLAGLPSALRMPRLAVPRTNVPAGSVAIAEEYTGIYPRRSPGGWRILGRTSIDLWNLDRDEPALLTPGTRVRLVAVP